MKFADSIVKALHYEIYEAIAHKNTRSQQLMHGHGVVTLGSAGFF